MCGEETVLVRTELTPGHRFGKIRSHHEACRQQTWPRCTWSRPKAATDYSLPWKYYPLLSLLAIIDYCFCQISYMQLCLCMCETPKWFDISSTLGLLLKFSFGILAWHRHLILPRRKASPERSIKRELRNVHSLCCMFFWMYDDSNQWCRKGYFRVTSSVTKVVMALSTYIPKEDTISSMLSTLQAHIILGSHEGGLHRQVTRSVTQRCASVATSWGGLPEAAPGHSSGQLSLFYFNIFIWLSCLLISLLVSLQAAVQ